MFCKQQMQQQQSAKCTQKQQETVYSLYIYIYISIYTYVCMYREVSNVFRKWAPCAGVASGGGGDAASRCSRLGSLLSVQEMNFLRKFIALTLIEWRFFLLFFISFVVRVNFVKCT